LSLYEGMVRLAWLDLRNIRKIIITSVFTPAILFYILQRFHMNSSIYGVVCNIPVLLISLLIIFWATGKTGVRAEKSVYESRFPISARLVWIFRFVVSFIVTTLIGIWFAACYTYWKDGVISTELCIDGALFFSVLFICCHVLSAYMPRYTVILIAVLWTMYGYNLGIYQWDNAGLIQSWKTDTLLRMLAGGLIALFFIGKQTTSSRSVWKLVCVLLILFIAATYTDIVALATYDGDVTEAGYQIYQQDAITADGSVTAHSAQLYGGWRSEKYAKYLGVSCRDYKTEKQSFWIMDKDTSIIDTSTEGKVFLAQQLPESSIIRILVGNCADQSLHEMARFRAQRGTLLRTLFPEVNGPMRTKSGSVSPDENLILVALASPYGRGNDLWAVNARTHIARVVQTNYIGNSESDFTWRKSLVYVSGSSIEVAIDFKTLTSRPLRSLIR